MIFVLVAIQLSDIYDRETKHEFSQFAHSIKDPANAAGYRITLP